MMKTLNIDDIYINHWGKPKPKFTEMELAIMEGGQSLEEYYEKNSNNNINNSNSNRLQFIKGLMAESMGRKSK